MKKLIVAGMLLACSAAVPALAQRGAADHMRTGRCQLQVNGTNRINGPCRYEMEQDGSFRIQEAGRRGDDFYFAYLSMLGNNTASGSWSGSRNSRHAHDTLGELTRHGACWTNRRARVCLRR